MFLTALVLGLMGAIIVFLCKDVEGSNKVTAFIILTIFYALIGWWIIYGLLPSTAYPLFGFYFIIVLIWWIISTIVAGIMQEDWPLAGWIPVVAIVVLIITAISGSTIFNSSDYARLIGPIQDKTQKHWSQDIQPLDPTHIRLVPKELAISLAKTSLSQNGNTLGSQFPLAENCATLQKIDNDYWYLVPLDYASWAVWTKADCVPGYVRVSATDPYSKPTLITGKSIKYTPGAWYDDNLERRLYEKYSDKILTDYSFEEDDNDNIYWVVSVCKPTIGYWGDVVEGVVLYDPETGEDKFISKEELKKNAEYAWIDRVVPAEMVKSYVDDWGIYKNGWWNAVFSGINLLEGETPTMNYSKDGRCILVTPVTSTSEKDQAMTGLMYTDARTGEFVYYTTSGGSTEGAVIEAVNNAISFKNWHASEQIVYENVYGKMSALVPILGQNGNYQGLAIVENENKRVAIGANPQETLVEFQKMIMNAGGQISTENSRDLLEYLGKVARIGWEISNGGKQYYIYISGIKNSFIVSNALQSELSLTREGDEIYIKYINSDQVSVPVTRFKNITLDLQGSKNEVAVDSQMIKRQDEGQIKADVKDFKESLNNMSDEEIKKLMKK